jgi:hypothetical protein
MLGDFRPAAADAVFAVAVAVAVAAVSMTSLPS